MVLYRLYFQTFTEKHRDKTDISALLSTKCKCRCPFAEMALDRVTAVMLAASWKPLHYGDVIWARWRLKSPAPRLFTQAFIQTQFKENIKAPRHWPLWGESVEFPHKGPVTRKMFPFDDAFMGRMLLTNNDFNKE